MKILYMVIFLNSFVFRIVLEKAGTKESRIILPKYFCDRYMKP